MEEGPARTASRPRKSAKELKTEYRKRQQARVPDMFTKERLSKLSETAAQGLDQFAGARASRASMPLCEMLRVPEGRPTLKEQFLKVKGPAQSLFERCEEDEMKSFDRSSKPIKQERVAIIIEELRADKLALPGLVRAEYESDEERDTNCKENALRWNDALRLEREIDNGESCGLEERVIDLEKAVETFGGRLVATDPIDVPILFDNYFVDDEFDCDD